MLKTSVPLLKTGA